MEESAVCRVCHGESEAEHPLFHPCKCSGSIKYVHQDCLLEWLRVSGKVTASTGAAVAASCELCGEEFHFNKKYKHNAPTRLSAVELLAGLIPRLARFFLTAIRIAIIFVLYIILLPFWTRWVLSNIVSVLLMDGGSSDNAFDQDFSNFRRFSLKQLLDVVSYWWNGVLVCLFILGCSMSVVQGVHYLRNEINRNDTIDIIINVDETVNEDNAGDIRHNGDNREEEAAFDNIDNDDDTEDIETLAGDEIGPQQLREREHDDDEEYVGNSIIENHQPVVEEVHQGEEDNIFPLNNAQQPMEDEPVPQVAENANDLMNNDNILDEDVIVVEVGEILSGPLLKTLLDSFLIMFFNFVFLVATVWLPTMFGRVFINFAGLRQYLLTESSKVVEYISHQYDSNETMKEVLADHKHVNKQDEQYTNYFVVFTEFVMGWSFVVELLFATLVIILIIRYQNHNMANHRQRGEQGAWWQISNVSMMRIRSKISTLLVELKKFFKSSLFIGIEYALPQLIGWIIDIIMLKSLNASLAARLSFFHEKPLIGGIIHFLVGISFMSHVSVCRQEVRRVLRHDVLRNVLPDEGTFLDEFAMQGLGDKPFMQMLQRVLLTMFYAIPSILFMILLPVQFGHLVSPFATTFRLSFNELYYDVQLPLELLVFQFLLPFLARKFSHRQCIRYFIERYLVYSCVFIGYDGLLDDEIVQEVWGSNGNGIRVVDFDNTQQQDNIDEDNNLELVNNIAIIESDLERESPSKRTLKGFVLLSGGLLMVFIVCAWFFHMPVVVGRAIMKKSGVSIDNDMYGICIGSSVILFLISAINFVIKEISQSAMNVISLLVNWVTLLIKIIVVGVIWFGLSPVLVGVLFEVAVVNPVRTPLNESSSLSWLQCWAMGLLFLNFWMRSLLVGLFGENNIWRTRFRRVLDEGILNIDLTFIINDIITPLYLLILDHLVFPYFIARSFGLWFTQSYSLKTKLVRFSFLTFLASKMWNKLTSIILDYLGKLHTEILDSKYLVGTELKNR